MKQISTKKSALPYNFSYSRYHTLAIETNNESLGNNTGGRCKRFHSPCDTILAEGNFEDKLFGTIPKNLEIQVSSHTPAFDLQFFSAKLLVGQTIHREAALPFFHIPHQ